MHAAGGDAAGSVERLRGSRDGSIAERATSVPEARGARQLGAGTGTQRQDRCAATNPQITGTRRRPGREDGTRHTLTAGDQESRPGHAAHD
jgi:hypothetical protein